MSVIFTQPKMTLKSYDFLLGQQVLDQDDTKMGQVGVLIYALAYLAEPESEYLPMLIAEIYIFMFLPYSASRESPQFKNQLEIDYFINRREKILRALEIVIKHVKDSRIISEILNGLELCVKIPDIEHKTIILKICCGIYTTDPDSVIKIENLVIKIREMHQELEKESIEA